MHGKTLAMGLVAMAAGILPARADGPDWRAIMAGIDGIIVYCDSSTKQAYAQHICDGMAAVVEAGFKETGLPVVRNGLVHTGVAHDGKVPAEIVTAPLKTAEGISRPMLMAVVIKGTDDRTPAIYTRVHVAIPFRAAVEAGASGPGKAGDLMVAERAIAGNGPKKQLPPAIVAALGKQLDALMADMREGIAKP